MFIKKARAHLRPAIKALVLDANSYHAKTTAALAVILSREAMVADLLRVSGHRCPSRN